MCTVKKNKQKTPMPNLKGNQANRLAAAGEYGCSENREDANVVS